VIILIDSREKNAPYIKRRFDDVGIDSDITCLPTETGSDYLVSGTFGSVAIQRKIVCSELISELDEIMFDIIPRLKNFSDNPVALIEENYGISKSGYLYNKTDNRETEMLATSYFGYLETIRKMGITVITTRGLNESIWWMAATHGYLGKEHYPPNKKTFTDKDCAVGILSSIPGIGNVRATKALSHNSIRSMVGMKHIEGFTQKQSDRLSKIFHYKS